jgi:hypothetical protein
MKKGNPRIDVEDVGFCIVFDMLFSAAFLVKNIWTLHFSKFGAFGGLSMAWCGSNGNI